MVLAGIHNLTDSSIFALANTCHYLEEIYLNGCAQVSPAAVRYLVVGYMGFIYLWHMHPLIASNDLYNGLLVQVWSESSSTYLCCVCMQ